MTFTINLQVRHVAVVVAAMAAAVALTMWWAAPARSAPTAEPVGSFAVVARADNPVDALAGSAVAAQLGAPVYLTSSSQLDEQARQGLVDTAPDVVVLAGGPVALSVQVEEQIAAVLPGAQLRRIAGQDRTETARLINQLPGELGIVRPVLAGATVAGDVGIDGALTVAGTDVTADLAALTQRLQTLEGRTATAESQLAEANQRIDGLTATVEDLQGLLAGVTRQDDTLRFSGMNLQVVNGTGTTDGTPNGLGNLLIGYDTAQDSESDKSGSHYLVVGNHHNYTSFGGIVAGFQNTASGDWASVTGGRDNTASREWASVTGGSSNTASMPWASVSGGEDNTASGFAASVSGGSGNTASVGMVSILGGVDNTVSVSYTCWPDC